MKLYKVTLTHTTVLLAESEFEAARAAHSHAVDIIREEPHQWVVDGEVSSLDDLPPKWDAGCIPWNTVTYDGVGTVLRELDQRTQSEDGS